jgi:DNA repair exonuclease SbcCD nuclease subunit
VLRTLVTSDWQAATGNLERCRQAADNLIRVVEEYEVEEVVFAGDLKHVYSPVPMDVILWWRDFVMSLQKIKVKHGIRQDFLNVTCLLGNHDRTGLYSDTRNWLPLLYDAGAAVHWKPEYVPGQDGSFNYYLPFLGTEARLEEYYKVLKERPP